MATSQSGLGLGLIVVFLGAAANAQAQTPEISFFADIRPTLMRENNRRTVLRWYDPNGHFSIVGVRLLFENGLRGTVTQRLQRIESSGDPDLLDEYYLEDQGSWRIGKQYLPFGLQGIIKESVLGASLNTNLVFEEVPIKIAVCDGGTGRTRGVIARIGDKAGISFAYGDHFGIQGTSLTPFQLPKDSLGQGRGWKLALGADFGLNFANVTVSGEWVSLRRGNTPLDLDSDLSDIKMTYRFRSSRATLSAAWSRSWDARRDNYRLEGVIPIDRKLSILPFIRYRNNRTTDLGVSARVRL